MVSTPPHPESPSSDAVQMDDVRNPTARWLWAVIAVTGVILAALYLLWAYQRVFHGPAEGENATMADLRPAELLGILPVLALIVFLGVYPKPVLERIEPAVDVLIAHLEDRVEDYDEDEPTPVERPAAEGLIQAAREAHEAHAAEGEAGEHGEDG